MDQKEELDEDVKNELSAYAKYSTVGIQMAVAIGGFTWLGTFLDNKFKTQTPWFTVCLSLFGVAVGLYLIIRIVLKNNK
jgi:ATP synthase protein I